MIVFTSLKTNAAVSNYYEGYITKIGYEASRGIIHLNNTHLGNEGCTGMYLDLNKPSQQAAYSTALTAKVSNSRVSVRYITDGVKYYNNCLLFQMTIVE